MEDGPCGDQVRVGMRGFCCMGGQSGVTRVSVEGVFRALTAALHIGGDGIAEAQAQQHAHHIWPHHAPARRACNPLLMGAVPKRLLH